MALTPGTRLGPYEVVAQIGVGGMGQVYRARDTKLDRDVAIKVLPEAFAADPERIARFQREAKTLASLNHPNIAQIYGMERLRPHRAEDERLRGPVSATARAGGGAPALVDDDGVTALVLELVEGPTLADRIARGAVPVAEALPIAKQIADAVEAAHEQGIIHRDLKPANVKVRADGTVKVLDFGLAKAMEPTGAMSPSLSQSPTITTPAMTQAGTILGTAAYMSPEQARGRTVDKRSDIWAFGAVLFEMLTGKRAFGGDDVQDTFVAIMQDEPDWARLPATLSPALGTFVRRCLQKDPRQRIHDIADVRLALEGAFESAVTQTTLAATAPRGPLAWMAALAVAAVVIITLAIPTVRHVRETPPPVPPETRTEINTPATDQPTMFALSPDGRQIVFVASGEGTSRLWLRSLATTTAQPLTGTEGARYPFWSPDNRSIGFFAGTSLRRLDFGGGGPQTLAPVLSGSGGTWNADGVILFAPGPATPLLRVSATGGAAAAVTTLLAQHQGHVFPHFLPDGRRFLFYVVGEPDTTGVYLGGLDGSDPTRLTPSDGPGRPLPAGRGPAAALREGGWLLWVRAGTLTAQWLDLARAALTGEPVTLADGAAVDTAVPRNAFSVAATGLVAYRTGTASQRQLTWFDRAGTARGTVGDLDGTLSNPRVSPDGRRVVVSRTVQGNEDLWLLDGARMSRFTFDAAQDVFPVWSPDGARIVFGSNRTGPGDLYQKLTSGAGLEERIVASDQIKAPTSWSADGRVLLYQSFDLQTNADIWVVVPMTGDRTPSVFLKTPFREAWGAFSPDGRWLAYQSNESGRMEIYVRPFVPPSRDASAEKAGGQWQVSTAGGIHPVWRSNGKELYYLNPAGAMMAAPIIVTAGTLEPGASVVLFPSRIYGGGVDNQQGRQYDVAPDGRFLINTELNSAAAPITLLMNWKPPAGK